MPTAAHCVPAAASPGLATTDRLPECRFQHVPLWGLAACFVYAMRRVDCPRCGLKDERVPWAERKGRLTTAYPWFLAGGAKHLSWN